MTEAPLDEPIARTPHTAEREFLTQLLRRKPFVSWAIAATCVAIFGLEVLWGHGEPVSVASRMGAEIPSRVLAGEWWRLLSATLLHVGVVHLAMNMLAFLAFGTFLERVIGGARYLILYILSGLGGSLLSLTRQSDVPGLGASGGIWGLMIAGAVMVTWRPAMLPPRLAIQLRRRAWTPVVLNGLISLAPGIDLRAHLGGGITGALLLLWFTRSWAPSTLPSASRMTRIAAVLLAAILAVSAASAFIAGKPWDLALRESALRATHARR